MKLIESTKYTDFYFDKAQSLLFVIRKKKTNKMSADSYKRNSLVWIELLKKYKPQKQLVNDINMEFIITPELQQWTLQNLILPAIEDGLKKVAFVESVDTFSKIAVEQTMEEKILEISFEYFVDLEEAKKWLEVDLDDF